MDIWIKGFTAALHHTIYDPVTISTPAVKYESKHKLRNIALPYGINYDYNSSPQLFSTNVISVVNQERVGVK